MLESNVGGLPYLTIKKDWGNSQQVSSLNGVDTHRIKVIPDGYCSVHRHVIKNNLFYLMSGWLKVSLGSVSDSVFMLDTAIDLLPGEQCLVPAGVWHYFKAGTMAADALEIYWAETSDDDIERLCPGGVRG